MFSYDSDEDNGLEREVNPEDPHNLNERFIRTHSTSYSRALAEIKQGEKRSCWSWWILPVDPWIVNGVERGSGTNKYYCLRNDDQTKAFLKHVKDGVNLRQNYLEIVTEIAAQLESGITLVDLLGFLDAPKAKSSFKLFHRIGKEVGDEEIESLFMTTIRPLRSPKKTPEQLQVEAQRALDEKKVRLEELKTMIHENVQHYIFIKEAYDRRDFDEICQLLSQNTAAKFLNASVCLETSLNAVDWIEGILGAVTSHPGINSLVLDFVRLRNERADFFEKFLQSNNSLSCLSIAYDYIGSNGAKCISNGLKVNRSLKELKMDSNSFGIEGIQHIAKALAINNTLERLSFSNDAFGNQGIIALTKALEANTSLTTLRVQGCEIGHEFLDDFMKSISEHPQFCELQLQSNPIGDIGAQIIAKYLNQTRLQELIISNCGISDFGMESLSNALKSNKNLTYFDCMSNIHGDNGLKSLLTAVAQGNVMDSLRCSINVDDISQIQLPSQSISDFLGSNCSVTQFSIGLHGVSRIDVEPGVVFDIGMMRINTRIWGMTCNDPEVEEILKRNKFFSEFNRKHSKHFSHLQRVFETIQDLAFFFL